MPSVFESVLYYSVKACEDSIEMRKEIERAFKRAVTAQKKEAVAEMQKAAAAPVPKNNIQYIYEVLNTPELFTPVTIPTNVSVAALADASHRSIHVTGKLLILFSLLLHY